MCHFLTSSPIWLVYPNTLTLLLASSPVTFQSPNPMVSSLVSPGPPIYKVNYSKHFLLSATVTLLSWFSFFLSVQSISLSFAGSSRITQTLNLGIPQSYVLSSLLPVYIQHSLPGRYHANSWHLLPELQTHMSNYSFGISISMLHRQAKQNSNLLLNPTLSRLPHLSDKQPTKPKT